MKYHKFVAIQQRDQGKSFQTFCLPLCPLQPVQLHWKHTWKAFREGKVKTMNWDEVAQVYTPSYTCGCVPITFQFMINVSQHTSATISSAWDKPPINVSCSQTFPDICEIASNSTRLRRAFRALEEAQVEKIWNKRCNAKNGLSFQNCWRTKSKLVREIRKFQASFGFLEHGTTTPCFLHMIGLWMRQYGRLILHLTKEKQNILERLPNASVWSDLDYT